jgi:hypothetical protein
MARLNLKADTPNQKVVLAYLEENASDSLVERINAGKNTLQECWGYIANQARKRAVNSCACIEDKEVFGWAIHFFEEDGHPGDAPAKKEEVDPRIHERYVKNLEEQAKKAEEEAARKKAQKEAEKKAAAEQKAKEREERNNVQGQLDIFSLMGGM